MPLPSAQTKYFLSKQIFFVQDKKFCPRLKSLYLLGKRIENDFKLWRNYFQWLKSYFPSISQAKMYFLAQDKVFCPGQNCFVQDKNYFVRYKKYFVWADGQGISVITCGRQTVSSQWLAFTRRPVIFWFSHDQSVLGSIFITLAPC